MTAATATNTVTSITNRRDPAWQVFTLLRIVLAIAPITFGLDKFFNLLTDWPKYLAPVATDIAPLGGQPFMYVVGVVEIIVGVTVLIVPRYGALLLAAWLAFIIANLLLLPGYFDVALRDSVLFVAALALFRLSLHRTANAAPSEQESSHA